VWNYATTPPKGSKVKVSLFQENQVIVISAYLRGIDDDPLGPTGTKGILEVHQSSLNAIKKARGPWQIYPPMETANNQIKRKKKPYEVLF
jgi:hypothetical protein